MSLHLSTPLSAVPGIGEAFFQDLRRLGLVTVKDLLFHIPFRYEDYSASPPVGSLGHGQTVTLTGTLTHLKEHPGKRRGMWIIEADLGTDSGEFPLRWFNQRYLMKTLREGSRISVAGRVEKRFGKAFLSSPLWEREGSHLVTGRILPVYSLSGSLTQGRLRAWMQRVLPLAPEITDWIPEEVVISNELLSSAEALKALHAPTEMKEVSRAFARLAFEELFERQLLMQDIRRLREARSASALPVNTDILRDLTSRFSFTLTPSQRRSAWVMVQELARPFPMNRLLQGDVGSGKTAVAALVIGNALHAGVQAAYVAPTELLAAQQYRVLQALFPDTPCALLTSSMSLVHSHPEKPEDIRARLAEGSLPLVVGTHALLQESVKFHALALVVIDEQHRFGVEQRRTLLQGQEGTPVPHLLSMTATPIPRSLALAQWGDLDVSILNERPPGRQTVKTVVLSPATAKDAYTKILSEVSGGGRAYLVCPRIEDDDALGVAAVESVAKQLSSGALKGLRLGVLHGRMKSQEKGRVLQAFATGELDVLVSTTVVEVGVDIPEATVMVVLGAEHFGLAQLHQLRGRVGRSEAPSFCFLIPSEASFAPRLTLLETCEDGFALAEEDLRRRGAGNLFGVEQSGFAELRFASLFDHDLVQKTSEAAARIFEKDPSFEAYPSLRARLAESATRVHGE